MNKFLETVSSKLAETWVAQVLSPAFAFWAGGLALWVWGHEGTGALGAIRRWRAAGDDASLIVLAVVFLLVVVVSGTLVQRAALPMLRLLEGYWPKWLTGPRRWLERRQRKRKQRLKDEWQAAAGPVNEGTATAEQQDRYVALDELLRRFPDRDTVMPTALGNTLRAGELRPRDRHGLDPTVCWVHLWLILPDSARAELTAARSALDGAAVAVTWSALFAVWTVWAWWVPLVAAAAIAIVHAAALLPAARTWADLVEATVDLYGPKLADTLRLQPPGTLKARWEQGDFITSFLQGREVDLDTALVLPKDGDEASDGGPPAA
ncbi:MAG TPA: hypothetical protein VFA46_00010 [Actinomycetes bacterium]|nr:hypothetical protein [Actinomycetes bacterium]